MKCDLLLLGHLQCRGGVLLIGGVCIHVDGAVPWTQQWEIQGQSITRGEDEKPPPDNKYNKAPNDA